MQLTKLDIAAIRQANDLTVHLSKHNPDGLVRLIKRKYVTEKDPFAQDVEHVLSAAVELYGFRGQAELKAGNVNCFAMVGIYHGQHTPQSCALKTLRMDDEVTFSFHPDYHSNGYVAMCNMHGDALMMRVRRDGKTVANWELHSSMCPENSARMCRGVPKSESYMNDAAEARKVA